MTEKNKKLRLAMIMGVFALLLHGGVAFYVNAGHGFAEASWAAVAQGTGCFIATVCSSWLMQFFFDLGRTNWQRFLFATFGAGGLMLSVMIAVHACNQTPELLKTVGAGALLALPYYIIFPLFLLRQFRARVPGGSEVRLWACPYSFSEFILVLKNNILGPSDCNKGLFPAQQSPVCLHRIDPQLRIGFLGDLMPLHGKRVSLTPELRRYLGSLDYLVANFEGSLFPSDKRGLLAQAHKSDILDLICQILPPKKIILSCANNHAADFGFENFKKNNAYLESLGFKVIGQDENPSIIIAGKIEITAVTEWSNQEADFMAGLLDVGKVERNAECFQILFPHWCYELELYPNKAQVDRAKALLHHFDLIVGHHSHAPGVVAVHKTDEIKKMVAYSLGDFTFAVGGPARKYYEWGQVMVAEFGPLQGKGDHSLWQQGETRWGYTHIVQESTKAEQRIELSASCPWFC